VAVFTSGAGSPTSGTATALVRCAFADAALGTLGTARGTAGAAAWGRKATGSEQTWPGTPLPKRRPAQALPPASADPGLMAGCV